MPREIIRKKKWFTSLGERVQKYHMPPLYKTRIKIAWSWKFQYYIVYVLFLFYELYLIVMYFASISTISCWHPQNICYNNIRTYYQHSQFVYAMSTPPQLFMWTAFRILFYCKIFNFLLFVRISRPISLPGALIHSYCSLWTVDACTQVLF